MLGQILSDLAQYDAWASEHASDAHKANPRAHNSALIMAICDKLEGVWDSFSVPDSDDDVYAERDNVDDVLETLTQTALATMVAMLHLSGDPAKVGRLLIDENLAMHNRMVRSKRNSSRETIRAKQALHELAVKLGATD